MAETTSSRLLTLLSLLQGRRDVDRLRELGYPVESLTGPASRGGPAAARAA